METATLRKKLPTKEERAKVGKAADAIYAPLREQLEKEHWGEYISINVVNGDYALASDHSEAVKAIKAKYPGIISLHHTHWLQSDCPLWRNRCFGRETSVRGD